MREIKFRAWDTKSCSWCSILVMDMVGNLYFSTSSQGDGNLSLVGPIHKDIIILQQYTGMRDQNNKEIYEGDILSIDIGNKESIEILKFDNASFYLFYTKTEFFGRPAKPLREFSGHCEWTGRPLNSALKVIGNIYENSELIPK